MPRDKYGSTEMAILEYLYETKDKWNDIRNIAQWLGQSQLSLNTLESMKSKKVIKISKILDVKAISITLKGKRIHELSRITVKSPIKRIDIKNAYHNRFRNPEGFIRIRIAKSGPSESFLHKVGKRADSISKGSSVKMGFTKSKDWKIQAVIISLDKTPEKEQELAIKIFNDIENWLRK